MVVRVFGILLFAVLGGCAQQYPLACLYAAADSGELQQHAGCAAVGEGDALRMADQHLQQLDFAADGLAPVLVAGQWYYLRRDGRHAAVISHDNGADSFAEGLVRTRRDGRIGYLDRTLHEVIAPRYDWGWPFAAGRALVCQGCYKTPADGDGHQAVMGGLWGYIDRNGREVVPVRLRQQDLPRY